MRVMLATNQDKMKRDWLSWFLIFLMYLNPGCRHNPSKQSSGQSQHPIIKSDLTEIQQKPDLVTLKIKPNAKKQLLSDFLSIKKLVFLQNNPPLGQITKIIHKNGLFYILDGTVSKLYCYDEFGKLIFEFGTKGEANGEVLGLDDFALNPSGESVYVLDHKGMAVSQIDGNNGEFIAKIKLNLFAHQIGITETEDLILFSDFSIWNESINSNIITLNQKSEIIRMEFPISEIESEVAFSKAHSLNSSNLFSPLLNDTIYEITSKGSFPLYLVDFGNIKLDYSKFKAEDLRKMNLFCDNYATRSDHIHETKSSLFFTFCFEDGFYNFYNKLNGEIHSIATHLFEDDIYGECISIKPVGIDQTEAYFIHVLDPFLVHDQIDYVNKNNPKEGYEKWLRNHPNLQEVFENTKPNDNPVLVFTEFKSKL
jgi:hypothetical protein